MSSTIARLTRREALEALGAAGVALMATVVGDTTAGYTASLQVGISV